MTSASSFEATIDDLCLDQRRSGNVHRPGNVHCPGAEMFPTTLEERAPRSTLTRDVSSDVRPSKNLCGVNVALLVTPLTRLPSQTISS